MEKLKKLTNKTMKSILIVETNLDAQRAMKERLVKELSDAGNLKKWGDDSVETQDNTIYFLKVISLTEYLGRLNLMLGRGYDELRIGSVIDEAKRLLSVLENYPNIMQDQVVNTKSEAPEQPKEEDADEDDLDDEDLRDEPQEGENEEKEDEEEDN